MKRYSPYFYLMLLLIIVLLFSIMTIYAFGAKKNNSPSVSARSATLYVPEIEKFILSKNAGLKMPMASTTKIMTALVAIENSDLAEEVFIDESAIGVEGSSAYLKQGDVLTMEELLYALLLQSANDVAVAIACHIGGNVENFVDLMNQKAASLGLTDTKFANPHGLHEDEHFTTAKDLALITAYALENEIFSSIVSTYKKTFSDENRSRTYVNHNKLLSSFKGCIGVKTGFTKKSGRCLVSASERDGLRLICVTLDAPNDWNDHRSMLEFGYENYENISLALPFDHLYKLPVIGGESDSVKVVNPEGAELVINKDEHRIDEQVKLVRYCVAPINRGDVLGEIIFSIDGQRMKTVSLVSTENIGVKKEKNLFNRIISMFK